MWKSGTVFLLVVCMLVLGISLRALASSEDLNREFVENFFRLDTADTGPVLRPAGSGATPDPGFTSASQANRSGDIDGVGDPSWVGKFLQLAIIALLGLIVYLLSRKSRTRGRGRGRF